MSFSLYVEVLIQGVLSGLVYGLMALGLSVIFGVVRVVNFAHGEFAVLAMYCAFVLFGLAGVDPIIASIPLAIAFFVLGYAMQRGMVQPFVTRPQHEQFILLVGVALVITNGLLLVFGPESKHVDLPYSFDSYTVAGVLIDKVRVYGAAAALAVTAALFAFFRFTSTGTAIRASADNLTGAAVVGLDVKRLYAISFGLGLACVGAAGSIMMALTDMTPMLAPSLTLLAFTIVIVGGLGSMTGALAGGLLIGVAEAVASLVVSPAIKSMVSFGLLVLVLALRPQGLFGKAES
ncbi:MAG: branched-chain amino acid ABC transporter permease [Hyphomicrobiales bacterium]|nr:branched-chain amino acid ABC transporter permease [Rhodoblastus sp.]MCB9998503.1 branched-chain amino acid ABC transporter permease [Methylobacteriaceae bacterium]MCC2104650.1 branched-chain amino acid ABC transporter permease [Hyphomicrobiales bacterium]MCO5087856.1 branched-chain amino acid ABC transporter permease [Methylobacteriaceae bacterium]HRY03238.1 branched-chain amino acid ABC transporter permease [Beijerinckiaceae bacterium]